MRGDIDRSVRVLVSPWILAVVPLIGILLAFSIWILLNDPHVWLGIAMTAATGGTLLHTAGQEMAVLTRGWLWVPFHRRVFWHEVSRVRIEPVPTTVGDAYSVVLQTNRRSRWRGELLSCTLPGLASTREDSPRLLRYADLIESRIATAQQR